MSKKDEKRKNCTSIGGQAVLEGVMMTGKTCMATAVRDPGGEIQIESRRLKSTPALSRARKIPFVRGIVNLVTSLVRGIKTLMRSAAVYGEDDEEESGRVETWMAKKFKVSVMDVVTVIAVIVGVALAVGIFVVLPRLFTSLICKAFPIIESAHGGVWQYVLWGVFKLVIFLAYLSLILLLKDIRRLYMYHGAEHKTINAYEHGVELVPAKVKECSRIHDRCGTSFLFIVILINIITFSLVCWGILDKGLAEGLNVNLNSVARAFAQVGIEIVLLPVIAGISYEILKILARFDNPVTRVLKAPGALLQKLLTTREPDEDMIAVAIAAFNKALEMDADPEAPETTFLTSGFLSKLLAETKKEFANADIDESDAEWIYAISLGIKRSELSEERLVKPHERKKIDEIIAKRMTGRPLWYIIGDAEFYGCKIKVDERALIPRPETELLCDYAVKSIENNFKVLDMCTGSGCIAIAIASACKQKNVQVTAVDVSDAAIMLAKENANLNSASVQFIRSDMFENVHGRFNVIVCNPPYVKSGEIPLLQREVREFEPKVALDGGADGLEFYRRLAKEVRSYLAKEGLLILECGEGQAEAILGLFPRRDYAIVMKDLSGADRFIKIAF